MARFLILLMTALALSGCITPKPDTPTVQQQRIRALSARLVSLDRSVDKAEADDLAKAAVLYTAHLAKRYRLVKPPFFHNILVNNGFRPRGLCYHWSGDLYEFLRRRGYKTLCFYHAGSDIGSYIFEHNSLVVVAKGHPFYDGIVLDGWRDSGILYFSGIREDKKYRWKQREYRCTGVFYAQP